VFDAPAVEHVGGIINGLPSPGATSTEDGHFCGGGISLDALGGRPSFQEGSRGVFAKMAAFRYTTKKEKDTHDVKGVA
jgi:hypothetical protein